MAIKRYRFSNKKRKRKVKKSFNRKGGILVSETETFQKVTNDTHKVDTKSTTSKGDVTFNDPDIEVGILLSALLKVNCDNLSEKVINNIRQSEYYASAQDYNDLNEEEYKSKLTRAIHHFRDDNIEEVLAIYYGEHMGAFTKEERQQEGKVYTPPEIVEWIHDRLEEQSPLSLHKTYWDPACGTGHFPLDWYNRLFKHWEENKDQYPEIKNEYEAYKWIIEKCIYFSDKDPFAIRLCILGLLSKNNLKYLEVGPPIFNRFEGDSLLDNPFGGQKFDYIAGNPPYVSKDDIDPSYKEKVCQLYKTYSKSGNLYAAFYELMFSRLHSKGVMGIISTLYWLKQDWGENLRTFLEDKIIYLYPLGEEQNFVQCMTFCSLTIGCHNPEIQKIIDEDGLAHDVDFSSFEGDPWIFGKSATSASLLDKIKTQPISFYDVFETQGGVPHRCRKAFVIKKSQVPQGEEHHVVPFVDGKDISKYEVADTDKRLIVLTPESVQSAPGLLDLLQHNKDRISEHSNLKFYEQLPGGQKAIEVIQELQDYIIFQYAAPYGKFALVTEPVYSALNNANYLIACNPDTIKVYLAILNSCVIDYWAHMSLPNNDSYTYKFGFDRLKDVTFPEISAEMQQKITPLVDKMLENPNDVETQAEIDKIVYDLYGLTEEEIKVIEEAVK